MVILEKEMATHSRILAWRIPGTGEPGGLPSMGSHRVGHDWSDVVVVVVIPGGSVIKNLPANAGDSGLIPGLGRSPEEGNGNPLQYSCLQSPMDRGAWWATVQGVARLRHNLATKPPPNTVSKLKSTHYEFPSLITKVTLQCSGGKKMLFPVKDYQLDILILSPTYPLNKGKKYILHRLQI